MAIPRATRSPVELEHLLRAHPAVADGAGPAVSVRAGGAAHLAQAAGVPDAGRPDPPGVDRGLLVLLADAWEVGEEVRPVRAVHAIQARVQAAQDLLAGVQPLLGGPGAVVRVPRLAGGARRGP